MTKLIKTEIEMNPMLKHQIKVDEFNDNAWELVLLLLDFGEDSRNYPFYIQPKYKKIWDDMTLKDRCKVMRRYQTEMRDFRVRWAFTQAIQDVYSEKGERR